jgi:hypothetical protein
MDYLRLSWSEIEEDARSLAREIRRRKVPFDLIVGISRGGWVPARILSDMLGREELYTLRIKFYGSIGETLSEPQILHPLPVDISGKDLLLVDDIADTGKSLEVAYRHLKERGAREIFVVTLVKKPSSAFQPDLFRRETTAWVIFPWEVQETIRDIRRRARSEEELNGHLDRAGIRKEEIFEEGTKGGASDTRQP